MAIDAAPARMPAAISTAAADGMPDSTARPISSSTARLRATNPSSPRCNTPAATACLDQPRFGEGRHQLDQLGLGELGRGFVEYCGVGVHPQHRSQTSASSHDPMRSPIAASE